MTAPPAPTLDGVLATTRRSVDEALGRLLPPARGPEERIARAMAYTPRAGGKRFRPALCLLACHAVGGAMDRAVDCAAALEMIHSYSLIHDDLPAMDDADLRRGIPSNHMAFGEALAILAGDGLLTLAFEVLASSYPDLGGALCREAARGAGWRGMIAGQAADIESAGMHPTPERVEYIHRGKTGALVVASLRMGARLGSASQEHLEAVTAFGEAVGLAFQIIDDILDETAEESDSGKSAGGDRTTGKITYPAVFGIDEARRRAHALTDEARRALAPLPRGRLLEELALRMVRRVS